MKFLVDACVSGLVTTWLRSAGHDVWAAAELGADWSDEDLLALARREARIVVTLDKDFGELIFAKGRSHHGLVRLADLSARQQVSAVQEVVKRYKSDLAAGHIVTVEAHRVRIRRVVKQ